jgi:hypothetical protein
MRHGSLQAGITPSKVLATFHSLGERLALGPVFHGYDDIAAHCCDAWNEQLSRPGEFGESAAAPAGGQCCPARRACQIGAVRPVEQKDGVGAGRDRRALASAGQMAPKM